MYLSLGWGGEINSALQRPPASVALATHVPSHQSLPLPFSYSGIGFIAGQCIPVDAGKGIGDASVGHGLLCGLVGMVILVALMPLRVVLCLLPDVLLAPKPAPLTPVLPGS